MKKSGYTLVELMVSVVVISIVLGAVSMVITSSVDTYNAGMRNGETGKQTQTFFSYIVNDLQLREYAGGNDSVEDTESDEEKHFLISKLVENNSVERIVIKERSWVEDPSADEVTYEFTEGGIERNGRFIVRGNRNFNLQGMDLKVYKNEIKEDSRILENSIDYLNNEIDIRIETEISVEDGGKRYAYYIEPALRVAEDELKRGYAFRFSNVKEGTGGETTPETQEPEGEVVEPPGIAIKSGSLNENDLNIPKNKRYWLVITFDSKTFWNKTDDGTKWADIIDGYTFNKVELFEVSNSSVLHSRYDVIETEEESNYTGQKRMKFYFETEVGDPPGNSDVIILQIHPENRYMGTEFEYYFKYRYE